MSAVFARTVATCEVFGQHTEFFLLLSNTSSDAFGEAGSVGRVRTLRGFEPTQPVSPRGSSPHS